LNLAPRGLGWPAGAIREIPFRYQVIDTLRDLAAMLLLNTGLLALNCVPVVGSIVAICGALYFNGYLLGRDFLDYPLALRGMRRCDKHAFCRRHRWPTLGLGVAVLLLALIPILGALVPTTATTGAVLLHRRLTDDEAHRTPTAQYPDATERVVRRPTRKDAAGVTMSRLRNTGSTALKKGSLRAQVAAGRRLGY